MIVRECLRECVHICIKKNIVTYIQISNTLHKHDDSRKYPYTSMYIYIKRTEICFSFPTKHVFMYILFSYVIIHTHRRICIYLNIYSYVCANVQLLHCDEAIHMYTILCSMRTNTYECMLSYAITDYICVNMLVCMFVCAFVYSNTANKILDATVHHFKEFQF